MQRRFNLMSPKLCSLSIGGALLFYSSPACSSLPPTWPADCAGGQLADKRRALVLEQVYLAETAAQAPAAMATLKRSMRDPVRPARPPSRSIPPLCFHCCGAPAPNRFGGRRCFACSCADMLLWCPQVVAIDLGSACRPPALCLCHRRRIALAAMISSHSSL